LNGIYDKFVTSIETLVDVPKKKLDLLWQFLQQNDGKFSARARSKEFLQFTGDEASRIEEMFSECWGQRSINDGGPG
jgi:hypothetical protein